MSFRRLCRLLFASIALSVAACGSAWGISIRPASFDHYQFQVPDKVQAGEEFSVMVSFMDRYGNEMPANWRPQTPLTLSLTPPATVVSPSALTRDNYKPGSGFRVRSDNAGRVEMKLLESGGREVGVWILVVEAGRPARLEVAAPAEVVAGETAIVRLTAQDRFGNALPDYEAGEIEAEGPVQVDAKGIRRSKGSLEVPLRFTATGEVPIVLTDRTKGLTAKGSKIRVKTAPLARFVTVSSAERTSAGQAVSLTLRAVDSLGNTVETYAQEYRGIRLNSSGGAISPELVAPGDFIKGVARVSVVLRNAGRHNVEVQEVKGAAKGEIGLEVVPGEVQAFEVRTPDEVVAGEPFEIVLRGQDAFGNHVMDLPSGGTILLRTTGTGPLIPDTVPASAYRKGEAAVKVRCERAEDIVISAILEGTSGAPPVPTTSAEPAGKPADAKRQAAEKAKEEALHARRESRLQEKKVGEKITETPPPQKLPAPKPPAPKPAPAPVPKPPSPAPAPKPVPTAPQAQPAPAPAILSTLQKPGFLDEIIVNESADRALITFDTNGLTDYTVSTSAKLSRKWIDVHFPHLKQDLPDRLKGGQSVVGEVYVENVNGGVTVSIEILPVRIAYDINQEGSTLVLKVLRQ